MGFSEKLLDAGIGWAISVLGDSAVTTVVNRLKARPARAELVRIVGTVTDSVAARVPNLAADLQTDSFQSHVLVPAVVQYLSKVDSSLDSDTLVSGFLEMFAQPFSNGTDEVDAVLTDLFRTEPQQLQLALTEFLATLRPALYNSTHWCHFIRDHTLEETRDGVLLIKEMLLKRSDTSQVSPSEARESAFLGSDALLSWPMDIGHEEIERPELTQLESAIQNSRSSTHLVLGPMGAGKSALLAKLSHRLREAGVTVFAIKADRIDTGVDSPEALARSLGFSGDIARQAVALARVEKVAVVIDQLDAISEMMVSDTSRMTYLLQTVKRLQLAIAKPDDLPIHIVISARDFEASFDARFQALKATHIPLALPSEEQVRELLVRLRIPLDQVEQSLHPTLRRPFFLRLFYDLMQRGDVPTGMTAGSLLDKALSALLPKDETHRREVLAFLEDLASQMTTAEALWRPADTFERQHPKRALIAALGANLITEQRGQLGFSHQAWLDDFQSKKFTIAKDLLDYIRLHQDGLFLRASVLRALQRLRALDSLEYDRSIALLLGEGAVRRHVQHLVVDLISAQPQPQPSELGLIEQLLARDARLARRSMRLTTANWPAWRARVMPQMSRLMVDTETRWSSVLCLSVEAQANEAAVIRMILDTWDDDEYAQDVFRVPARAGLWSPALRKRMQRVFSTVKIRRQDVVHYAKRIPSEHAAVLIVDHLEADPLDDNEDTTEFYGLEKLVERDPLAYARTLGVWLLRVAASKVEPTRTERTVFASSEALPSLWDQRYTEDRPHALATLSFRFAMQASERESLNILTPWLGCEVQEVQTVIADALAEQVHLHVEHALAFLLSDSRRFNLGRRYLEDEDNHQHTVDGYSTQRLVRLLVPHLQPAQLVRLSDAVEAWSYINFSHPQMQDLRDRPDFEEWCDTRRLALLAHFPPATLSAGRQAQVLKWKSAQPVLREEQGPRLISSIRSALTLEEMRTSTDAVLLAALDGSHILPVDAMSFDRRSSEVLRQTAYTFAKLADVDLERVTRLATQGFRPGTHDLAAGAVLSSDHFACSFSPEGLQALVCQWSSRGFDGREFRRYAAHALHRSSTNENGLSEEAVDLLLRWLKDESGQLAAERAREKSEELEIGLSRPRRSSFLPEQEQKLRPQVFGPLRGTRNIPGGNYIGLLAVTSGLRNRKPSEMSRAVTVLRDHAQRPEHSEVWTAFLNAETCGLFGLGVDDAVACFIDELFGHHPEAFASAEVSFLLWSRRALIHPQLLANVESAWFSGVPTLRQAAAEILMAKELVGEANSADRELLDGLLGKPDSVEWAGALFTAVNVWRDQDASLRSKAHIFLKRALKETRGANAAVYSQLFAMPVTIPIDVITGDLVEELIGNEEVLRVCIQGGLADVLQRMTFEPTYASLALRACQACHAAKVPLVGAVADNLVAIYVALQRLGGDLRTSAMNLYELLLDEDVYAAESAAEAATMRREVGKD